MLHEGMKPELGSDIPTGLESMERSGKVFAEEGDGDANSVLWPKRSDAEARAGLCLAYRDLALLYLNMADTLLVLEHVIR